MICSQDSAYEIQDLFSIDFPSYQKGLSLIFLFRQNMTKERPVTPDHRRVPDGEWMTVFKLWQTDVYTYTKK